jgi:signal peptide peptidase SppA
MRDFNVLSYVGTELWAIHADKMAEMIPALIRHAKGDRLSAEELAAFMGGRDENGPPTSTKRGAVAIIPIRGTIAHRMEAMGMSSGGASCERINAMVDQVKADEQIGTVVYDVDTPGGTVTGLMETAAKMFALRGIKKQIAVINGSCCSAGYWLASQCDEIVINPSGQAGSIGVFFAHKDLSAALEKEGIRVTLIKAGKYKTEGNPFEPLSEEAEAQLQVRVDQAYAQFVKDVARGRGVEASAVRAGYGEGRALPAKEAKAAGLVDRIGTMEDTLARLTGGRRSESAMRADSIDGELTAEQIEELAINGNADMPEPLGVMAAAQVPDEMRQRLERI